MNGKPSLREFILLGMIAASVIGCGKESVTDSPPDSHEAMMKRFATHRFVPVGNQFEIDGYGSVLESGSFDDPVPFEVDSENLTARCNTGGVGWVRFRYRDQPGKNGVQTMVIACVNELGSCEDLPKTQANLEKFRPGSSTMAANIFTSGNGSLYALCQSGAGVRLQQPPGLPALFYRIIDAWGDGPYSVAGDELNWIRNAPIINYSGERQQPRWIATIGREITELAIQSNGEIEVSWIPCSNSPECPISSGWLGDRDYVVINFGPPDLSEWVSTIPTDVQRDFAESHVPGIWGLLEDVTPTSPDRTAQQTFLFRLLGIDIMEKLVLDFNERYRLGEHGTRVGFGSFWETRMDISCLPGEQHICEQAEDELGAFERARINDWREIGIEVWWTDFLGYSLDGGFRRLSPPALTAFDGVLALLDITGPAESGVDRSFALANSIRSLGDEIQENTPVAFSIHWGPMEHVLEVDGFCEGEICPSAFTDYYRTFEPSIAAILETFAPGQVTGLGIPMMDGGHFDIKSPYETIGTPTLNRAAETGFNNPFMNLYYSR